MWTTFVTLFCHFEENGFYFYFLCMSKTKGHQLGKYFVNVFFTRVSFICHVIPLYTIDLLRDTNKEIEIGEITLNEKQYEESLFVMSDFRKYIW